MELYFNILNELVKGTLSTKKCAESYVATYEKDANDYEGTEHNFLFDIYLRFKFYLGTPCPWGEPKPKKKELIEWAIDSINRQEIYNSELLFKEWINKHLIVKDINCYEPIKSTSLNGEIIEENLYQVFLKPSLLLTIIDGDCVPKKCQIDEVINDFVNYFNSEINFYWFMIVKKPLKVPEVVFVRKYTDESYINNILQHIESVTEAQFSIAGLIGSNYEALLTFEHYSHASFSVRSFTNQKLNQLLLA